MADQLGKEAESVDSEIISVRRDSHASQVQIMNPKLTDLGPEVIIVKKQRTQKRDRSLAQREEKPTSNRKIKFERAGRQIDVTINSSGEDFLPGDASRDVSSDAER